MSSFYKTTGYSQYERTKLELVENQSSDRKRVPCHLLLDCISQLTPFDIVNLYNGIEDATGNKIWMGALFFNEAFSIVRTKVSDASVSRDNDMLMHWRQELFHRKEIIELGCGTGVSGLSILKVAYHASINNREAAYSAIPYPSLITFTDFDTNILDLCRRNFALNFCPHTSTNAKASNSNQIIDSLDIANINCKVKFMQLEWGDIKGVDTEYDTVLATDVLYDLSALRPLLASASSLLKEGGYFVLSHVPRASVDGALVGKAHILEEKICTTAAKSSLELQPFWRLCQEGSAPEDEKCTLRPLDIAVKIIGGQRCPDHLRDMDEAGASILIFRKTTV